MASITASSFRGFDNTRYLYSVLENPDHKDLKQFARRLFVQVSQCNQGRKINPHPGETGKFLDSMAMLLTGDEICAAVAISGSNLLIATNRTGHNLETISATIKCTILEKSSDNCRIAVGLKCYLLLKDGSQVVQKGPRIDYQYNCIQQKVQIISGDPKVSFLFDKKTYNIPSLSDDVSITVSLTRKCNPIFFHAIARRNLNEEVELFKPIFVCIGSLKRRAVKILLALSLVAHTTTREKTSDRVNSDPQWRFVQAIYQKYISSREERTVEGFIHYISEVVNHTMTFHSAGEFRAFESFARRQYKVWEKAQKAQRYCEDPSRWVTILTDTLTYELAKLKVYRNDISCDSMKPKGLEELDALYKLLLSDYQRFKKEAHLETSPKSIKKWLERVSAEYIDLKSSLPQFIALNPKPFFDKFRQYLIALSRIEEFVKQDARKKGHLSMLIKRFNIFKPPTQVRIIDGRDGVHAEMRLFDHHLMFGSPPSDYYGIAKLCCALCNYTLGQLSLAGLRVPDKRGTHTSLHDKWVLISSFTDDRFLKLFFGDPLFSLYGSLKDKVRHLDAPMKNGKRRDKSQYQISDVALGIVPRLGALNNPKALAKLNIDLNYLILGSDKMVVEEGE